MECNIIDLVIRVKSDNSALLAFGLHSMGEEFAASCRNVVCHTSSRVCDNCLERGECSWYGVFSQELALDPAALRRHQKPPLPFMFSFPIPELPPETDADLDCGLVVIGSAINSLGMLLRGFAKLLAGDFFQVRGEIEQIYSRDYQGTLHRLGFDNLYSNAVNLVVLSATGILESSPWNLNQIVLRLHSPLKLRFNDRQVRRFDLGFFARSLLRRVSSLVYYYEKCETGFDFKELSRQSDEVICKVDNFHYEAEPWGRKKMSGLMGEGQFSGNFSGLMPFLVVGAYLHLGKSASFGMGRYSIYFNQ